jgi:hypothetical protein
MISVKLFSLNLLLLFLLTFLSCEELNKNTNQKISNSTIRNNPSQRVCNLNKFPDSILVDKEQKENIFMNIIPDSKISIFFTKQICGEWKVKSGEVNFLSSLLDINGKLIFYNTMKESLTGWGIIRYNRCLKVYFSEFGSNLYDYYIDKNGELYIIQYEYRNEDLSIKKEPELIIEKIKLNWLSKNNIELQINKNSIELFRNQ